MASSGIGRERARSTSSCDTSEIIEFSRLRGEMQKLSNEEDEGRPIVKKSLEQANLPGELPCYMSTSAQRLALKVSKARSFHVFFLVSFVTSALLLNLSYRPLL